MLAMKDKSIPKLRKKLTKVFNEFIRLRDKDTLCISCGREPVVHAGHYFPTSSYPQPSMRFFEMNVHGQGISCNFFQEGNRQGYREGLIKRYGEDILRILDVKRSIKASPWHYFEYLAMIDVYEKKVAQAKNV